MDTGKDPADRTDFEPVDEIQLQVGALTEVSTQRHRLARDTPEYVAALEMEERLAARIWRLGAARQPRGERRTERQQREKPDA